MLRFCFSEIPALAETISVAYLMAPPSLGLHVLI